MDLSKLLGELYTAEDDQVVTEEDPSPPQAFETSPGPEWADEAHLDQVFASWVPGPTSDAPAAEREMAYSHLRSSLDEPSADQPPSASPTGAEDGAHGPAEACSWTRSDDDVLPYRRGRGRGRRLSLLRR